MQSRASFAVSTAINHHILLRCRSLAGALLDSASMTASKPCCCLVLLVVAAAVHSRAYAAPAAATTRAAPTALAGLAAADTIEAADAGKCDAALAKGDKTFHGYCPCRCQLQPNKRFDCAKCPATCKRYGFLCKREAAGECSAPAAELPVPELKLSQADGRTAPQFCMPAKQPLKRRHGSPASTCVSPSLLKHGSLQQLIKHDTVITS